MVDYVKSAATATRLITKFGQSVTLRHYTIGTYDPATGLNTVTTSDVTAKAVVFDFGKGQTLQAGNLIQAGDKQALMAITQTPALQDHVIVGGKEYVILGIGEVNPAGTVIIYDLHLRNG